MLADFLYAIRIHFKSKLWSACAILSLAIGMGCALAVFSIANAIYFKPLPFPRAGKLLVLSESNPSKGIQGYPLSAPGFRDMRRRSDCFSSTTAFRDYGFRYQGVDHSEQLWGSLVDGAFFSTLGANPFVGRTITEEDDKIGQNDVVVLSFRLWTRLYNGNPDVLGKRMNLSGKTFRIIGVLPRDFRLPLPGLLNSEVWVPLTNDPDSERASRGVHNRLAMGRLKSRTGTATAGSEMAALSGELAKEYPVDCSGWKIQARSLRQVISGPYENVLLLLLGGGFLLYATSCANYSSLLLAKGAERQRELAVRLISGATKARMVRQLFTESVVLALAGGVLGLGIALVVGRALEVLNPWNLALVARLNVDWLVIGVAIVLTILASLFSSLATAHLATGSGFEQALKEGSAQLAGGRSRNKVLAGLVVVEVAVSLALLLGTSLLLRSFAAIKSVDPGFSAKNVTVMRLIYDGGGSADPAGYFDQVVDELRNTPGIESTGAARGLPIASVPERVRVLYEGSSATSAHETEAQYTSVAGKYFQTMKVPIVMGREFSSLDRGEATDVAVISRSLAQRLFGGASPVGTSITLLFGNGSRWPVRVIGVAGDTRSQSLEIAPRPQVYVSTRGDPSRSMFVVVRSGIKPSALWPTLQKTVWGIDRRQAIAKLCTMEEILSASRIRISFSLLLLALLSGASVLLSVTGVFGLLSYVAATCTHEIGIRMSIGASPPQIARLMVLRGMKPVFHGMLFGALLSACMTLLVQRLLYDTKPWDIWALLEASSFVLVSGLIASLLPAVRAAKINPMDALRCE